MHNEQLKGHTLKNISQLTFSTLNQQISFPHLSEIIDPPQTKSEGEPVFSKAIWAMWGNSDVCAASPPAINPTDVKGHFPTCLMNGGTPGTDTVTFS